MESSYALILLNFESYFKVNAFALYVLHAQISKGIFGE